MSALTWEPAAPMIALALTVLTLALFTALRMKRRQRFSPAAAVQFLGLVVIATVLSGPVHLGVRDELTPLQLALLIDNSQSMQTPDACADDATTRLNALQSTWVNGAFLSELDEIANLQPVLIESPPRIATRERLPSLRGDASETPLDAALKLAIAAAGEGGRVLALSDGIETKADERELAHVGNAAAAAGVRIDAVVPGADGAQPNVRIAARAEPPAVFAGQAAELVIDIFSHGVTGAAELIVREDGPDGAVLERRTVNLPHDATVRATVKPRADADMAVFHVSLSSDFEEANNADNERAVVLNVLRDAVRVAVIEGRPYWESAFLIEALRHDPQIDVTSVTALTANREVVRTSSFSGDSRHDAFDPNTIAEFDVVFLGRGVERWFGGAHAALLHDFVVNQGGALVLLRGDPVSSESPDALLLKSVIENLAPVAFGAGAIEGGAIGVTAPGREASALVENDHAAFEQALADAPNVLATMRTDAEKALSVVWLRQAPAAMFGRTNDVRDDDPPAMAIIRVGRGRTLSVLADGMWRWALAPQSADESRGVYAELWRRLTRWLALGGEFSPGRLLSVRAESALHEPREPITITIRARRPLQQVRPRVSVVDPLGVQTFLAVQEFQSDALSWTATITPDYEGVYTVRAEATGEDESAAAHIAVYRHRRELIDTRPRRDLMRRIAGDSGGRLWELDEHQTFLADLMDRPMRERQSAETTPAWDHPLVFAIVLTVFSVGWLLERRERAT